VHPGLDLGERHDRIAGATSRSGSHEAGHDRERREAIEDLDASARPVDARQPTEHGPGQPTRLS
jgi:hypothetical protein